MSKKKKKSPPQTAGGYKKFIQEIHHTILQLDLSDELSKMSNALRREMYDYRIRFLNPVAGNNFVSVKELKYMADLNKSYFREKSLPLDEMRISGNQLNHLYSYHFGWFELLKQNRIQKEPEVVEKMKMLQDAVFKKLSEIYILNFFKVITQMSSPDYKYYGLNIRPAGIFKECPRFEFMCKIYAFYPRKKVVEIGGIKRLAFQLAKPLADQSIVTWITIETKLLKKFYNGEREKLDVYIQSHALKRMAERLDLLDKKGINYAIWKNTNTITEFKHYKKYLLLPFRLFDVVVGYLLANIVDDCLLFRTFLFVTHNCTPEGDRLKQLTGLSKEDINYWHIDRLSTFVNLKEEKYPKLMKLFEAAGLGNLNNLKEISFDINTMQEANLDGLSEYMQLDKAVENFCN
ncbi:MAG: hypothetical protein ACERKD_03045 [Prolixibacteraceae bacterium]